MSLWPILVLSVLMQGLSFDFERFPKLVNNHRKVRKMLEYSEGFNLEQTSYSALQTLVDNMSLLSLEQL